MENCEAREKGAWEVVEGVEVGAVEGYSKKSREDVDEFDAKEEEVASDEGGKVG